MYHDTSFMMYITKLYRVALALGKTLCIVYFLANA